MKIILLKDMAKLGRKFDVKDVSSGHALNLLIPRGDAVAATPQALKKLEAAKAKAAAERKVQDDLALKSLNELQGKTITMSAKANDKGHLFSGLHKEELAAELLKQTRLQIETSAIKLDHPIKETGEHMIEVNVGDKTVKFKLAIEAA
ncbi:MAG: 50S ribosomal protein L9 [Patescibacteria group bacterium]|nr:50S ribosomal protein L9 [Patescibacteria group bacterium]